MNTLFTKRALRGSLDRGLFSTRASDCDSMRFTGSRAKFDESVRLRFYALHWIEGYFRRERPTAILCASLDRGLFSQARLSSKRGFP